MKVEDEESQYVSPLQTKLNAKFRLNAPKSSPKSLDDGVKSLPPRGKVITQLLGLNSTYLFAKMHAKEIAEKVSIEIDDEENKKIMLNAETQTSPMTCDTCVARSERVFINRGTQIYEKEKTAAATQTDVDETPGSLAQLLSQLTSAQRQAIKDFATIVVQPAPQNPVEIYKVREQIMDVYNLSHRESGYRGDRDNRFPPSDSHSFGSVNFMDNNRNMGDFDRGGGPRHTNDFDMRNDDNFRRQNERDRIRQPIDIDLRMDYGVDDRRLIEEREREREREILLAEEERQRRIALEERLIQERNREEMERRIIEEERREQEMRFEQDILDFNRESPDRQIPQRPFNNQWLQRGGANPGARRSRGAWKGGRGRGR